VKTQYTMALAMLAGIALGGAAIQGLHAQAKPPVLIVTEINEVTNAEGFKAVTQRTAEGNEALKQLGGRYIARTEKITAIDGDPPKRLIIYAFDSAEKAQAYHNSRSEKERNENRTKNTKSRSFMVEGM